jgi:putative DNA primase/helicase
VTFAEHAPSLADFGYEPVPIRPGGKAPMIDGWQDGAPPERYLPHFVDWGTGVLTRHTPAIDLDIRDRGIVKLLIRLAEDMFDGPSPIRVGQPPKALLPFYADTRFDKIVSRWFCLPGEDLTTAGFKAHRIEVLGQGQQFVAFHVHPGTGRPYKWGRGSLLTYHAVDLAAIDRASTAAFVETADRIMARAGMIPLKLSGGRYKLDLPDAAPSASRRSSGTVSGLAWRLMDPGELAKAIDPTTAREMPDGSWRLRCPVHNGEHRDSLRIAKGIHQPLVWKSKRIQSACSRTCWLSSVTQQCAAPT